MTLLIFSQFPQFVNYKSLVLLIVVITIGFSKIIDYEEIVSIPPIETEFEGIKLLRYNQMGNTLQLNARRLVRRFDGSIDFNEPKITDTKETHKIKIISKTGRVDKTHQQIKLIKTSVDIQTPTNLIKLNSQQTTYDLSGAQMTGRAVTLISDDNRMRGDYFIWEKGNPIILIGNVQASLTFYPQE